MDHRGVDKRVRRVWTDPRLVMLSLLALAVSPALLLAKLLRYVKRRHPSEINPDRWTMRKLNSKLFEANEQRPGPHVVLVGASLGELMIIDRFAAALRCARPDLRVTYCVRDPKTIAYVLRERPQQNLMTWPFDALPPVLRWLSQAKPDLVVFTERFRFPIWSLAAARFGACVVLINGRSRKRDSFWYRLRRPIYRWHFSAFSAMLMQRRDYFEAAKALISDHCDVRLTGDLKLELELPVLAPEAMARLQDWLKPEDGPPFVAAGSVDDVKEAAMVLDAFGRARSLAPCRLLLAPRQMGDVEEIVALVQERGLTSSRRSLLEGEAEVYVLDTLGELAVAYGWCRAAYVGGSYHPAGGGHNVLEPLLSKVPVAYGMSRGYFEALQVLCEEHGVGTRVAGAEDLAAFYARFVRDAVERERVGEAGLAMVTGGQGAMAITLNAVLPLIPPADRI